MYSIYICFEQENGLAQTIFKVVVWSFLT